MNSQATLDDTDTPASTRRGSNNGTTTPGGASVWDIAHRPATTEAEVSERLLAPTVVADVVDAEADLDTADTDEASSADALIVAQPASGPETTAPSARSVDRRLLMALVVVVAAAAVAWLLVGAGAGGTSARSVATDVAATPLEDADVAIAETAATADDDSASDLAAQPVVETAEPAPVAATPAPVPERTTEEPPVADVAPEDEAVDLSEPAAVAAAAAETALESDDATDPVDDGATAEHSTDDSAVVGETAAEPAAADDTASADAGESDTADATDDAQVQPAEPAPEPAPEIAPTDGRVVEVTTRVESCQFSSRCLVVGFSLVGFDAVPAEFQCEFSSGTQYSFDLPAATVTTACKTGRIGDSITIIVDGVRSATIVHG